MSTLVIKIDDSEKNLLLSLLKKFKATVKEIKEEKSPYNPEFVKKIKRAEKQKGIIIDTNDIWGSLGLK